MTVYVETNFILEIAFLQDDHERCQQIINWAREGTLKLVLPAFCVGEPYGTWIRRAKRRRRMLEQFNRELNEMTRSEPYAPLSSKSEDITSALIQSVEHEKARLDDILEEMVVVAELVALEKTIFHEAIRYQDTVGLSPQDAIVYASVIAHLGASGKGPKCFLNKNAEDFADPDIIEELDTYGCQLITHFGEGFGIVRAHCANTH